MSDFNADMNNDIVFEFGAFDSDGFTFLPSETISCKIWYRNEAGTPYFYDFSDGDWKLSGSVVSMSGTLTPDTSTETYYHVFNPANRADQYTIQVANSTPDSVAKGKQTRDVYVSDFKRHR